MGGPFSFPLFQVPGWGFRGRRWSQNHGHAGAFEFRRGFDYGLGSQGGDHLLHQFRSDFGTDHFPPPEYQGDLGLVPFLEEPLHIMNLDSEIVVIDMGTELELLDLSGSLMLFHGMDFLALFVLELSIIHELADGRFGVGRNFDQVEACFFGFFDRNDCGNDAKLLSVGADKTDFLGLDLIVDTCFGINQ